MWKPLAVIVVLVRGTGTAWTLLGRQPWTSSGGEDREIEAKNSGTPLRRAPRKMEAALPALLMAIWALALSERGLTVSEVPLHDFCA